MMIQLMHFGYQHNKSASKVKRIKNNKNEWEKPKKTYNWVTGART